MCAFVFWSRKKCRGQLDVTLTHLWLKIRRLQTHTYKLTYISWKTYLRTLSLSYKVKAKKTGVVVEKALFSFQITLACMFLLFNKDRHPSYTFYSCSYSKIGENVAIRECTPGCTCFTSQFLNVKCQKHITQMTESVKRITFHFISANALHISYCPSTQTKQLATL